jgi:hypothetical protein
MSGSMMSHGIGSASSGREEQMVGQTGMPGNEDGGGNPLPARGSLQPPVFEPPLSLPAPQPNEDDGDPSTRKRVLWAFGAAAALFGAGVVGLALPNNPNDGVNVSTEDTAGPTTAPGSRSEEEVRTLVAPVFAPFTYYAALRSGVACLSFFGHRICFLTDR